MSNSYAAGQNDVRPWGDWKVLGQRQFDLPAGQSAHIDTGDVHRIANNGMEDVVFIEVQTGPILSEDDIERLEDSYGRS